MIQLIKSIRNILFLGMLFIFQATPARTETVRLAILGDQPEAVSAADILTAELSKNPNLNLLERAQMEKILREQHVVATTTASKDFLRLGQILGADGLLFLETSRRGTNSFLSARLVAVKQGVVLDFIETILPLKDPMQFAEGAAKHLAPFFPKLTVLPKDAVPISILNIRASANSKQATRLERELTVLLINRLMRERDIFVLERRRMEALSSEKGLKSDESPFWNGSYLLEGTIDKNGFSQEQITVSARMSPPNGGAPTQIELAGKRENLPEVADALAKKILQALQKSSSAPEWKPAEEAAKYFEEANWALKWGITAEAQSAADSAWALGKRDLDAAIVRVKSYRAGCAFFGQVYLGHSYQKSNGQVTEWTTLLQQPDPGKLDSLLVALNLYYEFSQTLSSTELKWNSPWCLLGMEVLDAAGEVLQHFHFDPKSQGPVAGKLADARALARSVSDWLLDLPAIRDIYWLNGKTVSPDTLNQWFERGSVQRSVALYGRFWQERPEDCVALYRKLMSGEGYHRIRKALLQRKQNSPLLCAWNPGDRQRAPQLWENFLEELGSSTNVAWKIEEKLQRFADVNSNRPGELEKAFEALRSTILNNRQALVQVNAEVFKSYDVMDLVSGRCAGVQTAEKERIKKQLYPEFDGLLRSIEQEFRKSQETRLKEEKNAENFPKQKEYLEKKTPYNFSDFIKTFPGFFHYSPEQARELQPLLDSYKADMETQLNGKTGLERAKTRAGLLQIKLLEQRLARPVAPSRPVVVSTNSTNRSVPTIHAKPVIPAGPKFAQTTNVLVAKRFFRIPVERLDADSLSVIGHRYSEGKILLDLRYAEREENGEQTGRACVGIWNPNQDLADFIPYPNQEEFHIFSPIQFGRTGLNFELFDGSLYIATRNGIHKFDLQTRRWQSLDIPVSLAAELFTVDGRLFAATSESIFEIQNGGKSTHILASTRRRPAVSSLDSLEQLGQPVLFPGPNHSIRTWIGKVRSWNGGDWVDEEEIPASRPPAVFEDGVIFTSIRPGQQSRLWLLAPDKTVSELCLSESMDQSVTRGRLPHPNFTRTHQTEEARPRWENIEDLSLIKAAAAPFKGNLFFFVEHAVVTNDANGELILRERDGRHANLVCLDREFPKPFVVPLKFDLARGVFSGSDLNHKSRTFYGLQSYWIVFSTDNLIIGNENMPGCWTIPQSEIKSAFAIEKEIRRHGSLEKAAMSKKRHDDLLAKYDADRDGKFSPAEKVKMLGDTNWLEEFWPTMDLNQNHFIDSEDDLSLLDVNENGVAEPTEVALLDKLQFIVARELIARFDRTRDGLLDSPELDRIDPGERENPVRGRNGFNSFNWASIDADRDGKLNASELNVLLSDQTRDSIIATQPNQMDIRMSLMRAKIHRRRLTELERNRVEDALASALSELWHRRKSASPSARK